MEYALDEPFDFSDGVNISKEREKELIDRAIKGLLDHPKLNAYDIHTGNLVIVAAWGVLNEEGTKRRIDVIVARGYKEYPTKDYFPTEFPNG